MNLPNTAAECGSCRSQKRWVLHQLRFQGRIQTLCTNCVLLSHRPSFCPSCFHVYDGSAAGAALPPPSRRVQCSNCRSFSHSHCVPNAPISSPYKCPPCADPGFSFFDVDLRSGAADRVLDKRLAGALVCAARIASGSMKRAAVVAREEAMKEVSVAAHARKKAREALDNLARVVSRERAARKEASSVEMVSGPVNPNAGAKFEVPDQKPGNVVKLQHYSGGGSGVSANLSSAVGLRHSHSEGFDKKPGNVVKVQHYSGGGSKVSANPSSAVGLRHSHSEGFDQKPGSVVKVQRYPGGGSEVSAIQSSVVGLRIGHSEGFDQKPGNVVKVQRFPGGGSEVSAIQSSVVGLRIGHSEGFDQKPGNVVKMQHYSGGGSEVSVNQSSAVGLRHSHSEGFDQKPGNVVKVQHYPGGGSKVSANLSSAVGLRHGHSEGFDRFVAETAGMPRKVPGTGSSINGSNAVKLENHNAQKLPLQNSNGKDYLGTGSSINGSNAVKLENHNEQKPPQQNSNEKDCKSSDKL